MRLLNSRHASRVDGGQVNCPVLVIADTEDRITPASVVQKVANQYPRVSTGKIFEGNAHWLMAGSGWQTLRKIPDSMSDSVHFVAPA